MSTLPKKGDISFGLIVWVIVTITFLSILIIGARYINAAFGHPGPNLVLNPSFKQWADGLPKFWQADKNAISQATDSATGKFALRLKGKSLGGSAIVQDLAGLQPNAIYLVSLETKTGSGSATFTYSYKTLVSGTPVESRTTIRRSFPKQDSYTSFSFLVRLPQLLSGITGQIGIQTEGSQDVLIDDVSVAKQGYSLLPILTPGQ